MERHLLQPGHVNDRHIAMAEITIQRSVRVNVPDEMGPNASIDALAQLVDHNAGRRSNDAADNGTQAASDRQGRRRHSSAQRRTFDDDLLGPF